jgi:hypothetical protein
MPPKETKITGFTKVVTATVTRENDTNAYTAGDLITPSTTAHNPITFSDCARNNGGSGIILDAVLIDSACQTTKLDAELYLFDTTVAPVHDNAAWAPSDAELATLVAVIDFGSTPWVGDPTAGTGNVVYQVQNNNAGFVCGAASRNLFGVLVARNAYTPVGLEVFTIRLKIVQD